MSTYELDDELVRQYVEGLTPVEERHALRHALADQLPPRVPTKVGAVVRTDKGVAVLVNLDPRDAPWMLYKSILREPTNWAWSSATGIGRITEVLSEGVDL
jgi:hypothetical protein